ncbi:MAG: DnaJ domain-containing protein [Burkholderiales bacterium]|nr:DnaJ domain-containing protein [Burkholderiales bacterium]
MPTASELIPRLEYYWEYAKKLFVYAQYCVAADTRDPLCGDFWNWALYASIAVAALVLFVVARRVIERQLEYRKLEKMAEAKRFVADAETMNRLRWTGDAAASVDATPEELAERIREALKERANPIFRRTHYEIVGVLHDASTEEIKEACVQLGDKYRPDKNPGDRLAAEAFSAVEKAFEVLTDPEKRANYDASIRPR